MNFRLTMVLVIVMLGTLMLYVGIKSRETNAPAEDALTKNALLSPAPKEISTISFTQDGEKQVAFVKNGEEWSLTFPVAAGANSYEVSSIADTLKGLSFKEKFEPEGTGVHSAESTGTDKPRNVVTFTDEGNREHRLGLGKTTVGGVYATLDGGKTIYLLTTNPMEKLDQDPQTFRNKTLKETPAEKITGITIKHPDQTVSLVKSGDKWMIDSPIASRANATAVEEIVNEMKSIHASAFSDFSKEMPATGLRTPVVAVTVMVEEKAAGATTAASQPATAKAAVTLELGYFTDLMNKTNVYAGLGGTKDVFTVSADTFNKLNRQLKDLRDPAITPAAVSDATNVSITTAGGPTTELMKQNGSWVVVLRGEQARTLAADAGAVSEMLTNVRNLRAIKFVDNAGDLKSIGLDPPRTRVELTLPGQSQHEVILIGKPENADPVTPMMRQGEPTVYLVQSGDVEKLALTPLMLRDRTVERLTANNIRSISIGGSGAAGGGVKLERDGAAWKVMQDGKPGKADDTKVTALLGDFTPLTAVKYVGEGETVSGKPDVTVTISTTESAPAATGPSTLPAAPAMGPNLSRPVSRTLRLYKVGGAWRALWDGGAEPRWTFEPNAGLVERVMGGFGVAATK